MRAPSPTYFCTSSLPMTRMKHASVRLATARASSVLPARGGETRQQRVRVCVVRRRVHMRAVPCSQRPQLAVPCTNARSLALGSACVRTRAGRAVTEHALGGVYPQLHKLLGVQHGQLHHLPASGAGRRFALERMWLFGGSTTPMPHEKRMKRSTQAGRAQTGR